MRYAVTVFVSQDDIGPSVAALARQYGSLNVEAIDDDELDDDETAADIDAIASGVLDRVSTAQNPAEAIQIMRDAQLQLSSSNEHMRVLGTLIKEMEDAEADPTPPHGIERPGYWVNKSIAPTSGSGKSVRGLETIECPECHAPVGEVCITDKHGPYRRTYGHAARRRELMLTMRPS